MKHGRTYRRRKRKLSARKLVSTEMLQERVMSQWLCANGFNKRDCHVAVRCFSGAVLLNQSINIRLLRHDKMQTNNSSRKTIQLVRKKQV